MISTDVIEDLIDSLQIYKITQTVPIVHDTYTIICVLEGELDHPDTNLAHLLRTDILLLPPGNLLELHPVKPTFCLIIQLKTWFLLETLEDGKIFNIKSDSIQLPELKNLFTHLTTCAKLYYENVAGHKLDILSQLYSCVSILNQQLLLDNLEIQLSNAKINLEDTILTYINKHYKEAISLKETAKTIGITPQYLSSYFQKNFGCTFMDYLSRVRANKCHDWLIYTDVPDATIAKMMGFKNIIIYQQALMDHYHQTPQEVRLESPLPTKLLTIDRDCMITNHDTLTSHLSGKTQISANSSFGQKTVISQKDLYIQKTQPVSGSWNCLINLGYGVHLADNHHLRDQIRELQKEVHFSYGRICKLLDLVTVQKINDKTYYNFNTIYDIIDFVLSLDMIPLLEIGNKDLKINLNIVDIQILSTTEEPLDYYQYLLTILPDFMKGCCNRYGIEHVSKWRFEIYYNFIDMHQSKLTLRQYMSFYKQISTLIHRYAPLCKIGGPGFNTYTDLSLLHTAMDYYKEFQLQPDFLTIYVYSVIYSGSKAIVSTDSATMTSRTINAITAIHSVYPKMPIWITEFSLCHSARNYLNDSLFHGIFLLNYLIQNMDAADAFGYHLVSDISLRYTDSDDMFFGGNGLYSYHGLQKPTYHIYSFLRRMGPFQLYKDDHCLITTHSKYRYQGLFFNYTSLKQQCNGTEITPQMLAIPDRYFHSIPTRFMRFRIHSALAGLYLVKVYAVNQVDGNILQQWYNSNYMNLSNEKDISFFRNLAQPAKKLFNIEVQANKPLEFFMSVEPLETLLILIEYNTSLSKNHGGYPYEDNN